MVNQEDKIDLLVTKVGDLAVSVRGIEVRLDNVENTLRKQEVALNEVSMTSSEVKLRMAEMDAASGARNGTWSKLQPFALVIFTMLLTGGLATVLHVYG
jgi:hypothetical protein